MLKATMRSDWILLLTLLIIRHVAAISDISAGPLKSRHLALDIPEARSDPRELHVQQALSMKSIVALKHGGDDVLKNYHDAVSMPGSNSDSDSMSSESHLSASAVRNIHAQLEEDLRRVVKFLREIFPVSLSEVKKDKLEFETKSLLQSFDERPKTKQLRLRHSGVETSKRSLRGSHRKKYDEYSKDQLIEFWIWMSITLLFALVGICVIFGGAFTWLSGYLDPHDKDQIPAGTGSTHEVQIASDESR
jgi:hypothetical protein